MLRVLIVSVILISLCLMIHTFGLVLLADWQMRHSLKLKQKFSITRSSLLLVSAFAAITVLHLLETFIWAVFYYWWRHFSNLETSWYFSLGSYTTIGYGDVVLPAKWRMLGGVEGINGVLLCGMSTAFLFLIIIRMFEGRIQHKSMQSGRAVPNDAD